MDEHAHIQVYDPKVSALQMQSDLNHLNSRSENENAKYLTTHSDPYDAVVGAHALAVITEWDEFRTYDWQKIYDNMSKPAFVFDGRNLLDQSALETIGFSYKGVGQ
jgi:UDPglucose 6-dehydrogenase